MLEILAAMFIGTGAAIVVFAWQQPEFHRKHVAPAATFALLICLVAITSWNVAVEAVCGRVQGSLGSGTMAVIDAARASLIAVDLMTLPIVGFIGLIALWLPLGPGRLPAAAPRRRSASSGAGSAEDLPVAPRSANVKSDQVPDVWTEAATWDMDSDLSSPRRVA